jgi:tyrosyl-tRNA synthetase
MQGYDSYFMDTDIQLGGADQTFNMQAGRTLLRKLKNKDSFVLVNPYLTGTDGRKMSKSWNNAIWLSDEPNDMYGKAMSIKDELISEYFTLATKLDVPDLSNPLQAKKQLAHQIVLELWGQKAADEAQKHFESTVQNKELPTNIKPSESASTNIVDILVDDGLAKSRTDAKRLIEQGAVRIDNNKVGNINETVDTESVISVGSRKFVKR